MQQRWFDQYQFDLENLRLSYQGESVALRPKAAAILKLLLISPGHTVSKKTLLEQAWGSRLVADQNLFQAISELRTTFSPLQPILTHPNLGYAWCLPTEVTQPSVGCSMPTWATAAALAAMVMTSGLLISTNTQTEPVITLSPSIEAFNRGLEALERHPGKAAEYFALTLRENPHFLEARLMLAQALLLTGQIDEARTEAEHLYVLATDLQLDYLKVGVMGLMSRLDESSGQRSPAIDWAKSAVDTAKDKGFACAAEGAERRLVDLLAQSQDQSPDQSLNQPSTEPDSTKPFAATDSARQVLVSAGREQKPCDPLLGEATPETPETLSSALS